MCVWYSNSCILIEVISMESMFYGIHVFEKNWKTCCISIIMVNFTILSKLVLVAFIFKLSELPSDLSMVSFPSFEKFEHWMNFHLPMGIDISNCQLYHDKYSIVWQKIENRNNAIRCLFYKDLVLKYLLF